MSWPDTIDPPEMTLKAVSELLAILSDCPLGPDLRLWVGHLRGEEAQAKAQDPMFR